MDDKPKTVTLRDANQQFSKLVREVEESGQEFVILRNGKEAARLSPAKPKTKERKLTAEQQRALDTLFEVAARARGKSSGKKLTRDELHER